MASVRAVRGWMGQALAESQLWRVRAVEKGEGAPMKLHFALGDLWTACGLYCANWYTASGELPSVPLRVRAATQFIAEFRAEEHRCKQCERRKVVRNALS